MTLRLSARLFLSHTAVAVAGAAAAYTTVRLLAPHLFDNRMSMMGGARSMMTGSTSAGVHAAFISALNTALLVGLLASVAAAAAVAALVTRRALGPLTAVRLATRQIAAGRYDARAPLPSEPELAELSADVNALAQALAATETRRTRLLGEVAHEMRTPLTALDGYVEGMIDGVFTADAATLESVSAELQRLRRLAEDLSSLSRTEERRLDLHLAQANLADLAGRAAARLAPQFEDAGVTLTVSAPAAVQARVDPDRIIQVLTNLLGNALAATDIGGTVSMTAALDGEFAEVTVSDTGSGIAAEDLDRIFERFYRVPGQTRRSAGSGIGLTIARGIAQAHGGQLTATSTGPGQGATFTLAVPASHGSQEDRAS